MSFDPVYTGVDQGDVASFGNYRCYVLRNAARNSIDGHVFVEQEDGQRVLLWSGTIRDVENDGSGDADMPKVVANSTRFVAHWIENGTELHRAVYSPLDAAWTHLGSSTIGTYQMYDVDSLGGSEDIIITWVATGNVNVTTARYTTPFAWVDTVWLTTVALTPAATSLAICGRADGGADVVIAFENVLTQLIARRFNASDGATPSQGEVFADFGAAVDDGRWVNIGMHYIDDGGERVIVCAEVLTNTDVAAGAPDHFARHVVWKEIRGSNVAPLTAGGHLPNAHLISRPWAYASGILTVENAYAVVAYKTMTDGNEWGQSIGLVINLDRQRWSGAGTFGDHRALPVGIMSKGALIDGRPSGSTPGAGTSLSTPSRRMCHVSHVSHAPTHQRGPSATSVVIAATFFESLAPQDDQSRETGELTAAQSAIKGIRHHHIDPWAQRLDSSAPALPTSDNFRGVAPYSAGQSVEIGPALLFSGGILSSYDGRQVVEVGFCWRPEIVDISINTELSDAISAGTYYWTATYSWRDRDGHVHRSAPATPISASSASEDFVVDALRVRCINLTVKDNRVHYPEAPAVSIEIWRTARSNSTGPTELNSSGDMLFRKVHSAPSQAGMQIEDTPQSDPGAWYITATDTRDNASLLKSELLPWQLNTETLQWTPATPTVAQSARVMTTWQNRLFTVPAEDPRIIAYSDEFLPVGSQTALPEYFDTNEIRFDSRGLITAMHPMDDQLIVFTRDAIYAITGRGNDGNGTGATYEVQVIADGIGCIEPRSLALTRVGLLFQSDRGIELLSRNLDIADQFGARVEDTVQSMGNIRAAHHMADRFQVRFIGNLAPTSSVEAPQILCWDYQNDQWSTFPMPSGAGVAASRLNALQAGLVWRGRPGDSNHVVLAQRALWVERASNSTVFGDTDYQPVTQPTPLDVTIGWLNLADLAGFKRIREIGVQLEARNASEVSVDIYYDRDGTYAETSPTDTFTWASPAPSYLRVRPSVQKCSAILIRIYESGTVPTTENIRITGIVLEVGRKRGLRRVAATQIGS